MPDWRDDALDRMLVGDRAQWVKLEPADSPSGQPELLFVVTWPGGAPDEVRTETAGGVAVVTARRGRTSAQVRLPDAAPQTVRHHIETPLGSLTTAVRTIEATSGAPAPSSVDEPDWDDNFQRRGGDPDLGDPNELIPNVPDNPSP